MEFGLIGRLSIGHSNGTSAPRQASGQADGPWARGNVHATSWNVITVFFRQSLGGTGLDAGLCPAIHAGARSSASLEGPEQVLRQQGRTEGHPGPVDRMGEHADG